MNSLLRIRTFNIPKSCIYYANSTENNNVPIAILYHKVSKYDKKLQNQKLFICFCCFRKEH